MGVRPYCVTEALELRLFSLRLCNIRGPGRNGWSPSGGSAGPLRNRGP